MTRLDQFGDVAGEVVPPPRADLGHRVRRADEARVRRAASRTRSRPPTRRSRSTWRRRARTSRCSSGSSSATAPTRPGTAGSSRAERRQEAVVRRVREGREGHRRPDAADRAGQVADDPARHPVPHLRQRGRARGRHHLRVYDGKKMRRRRPAGRRAIAADQTVSFLAKFKPVKGKSYIADADRRRQARPVHQARRLADGHVAARTTAPGNVPGHGPTRRQDGDRHRRLQRDRRGDRAHARGRGREGRRRRAARRAARDRGRARARRHRPGELRAVRRRRRPRRHPRQRRGPRASAATRSPSRPRRTSARSSRRTSTASCA